MAKRLGVITHSVVVTVAVARAVRCEGERSERRVSHGTARRAIAAPITRTARRPHYRVRSMSFEYQAREHGTMVAGGRRSVLGAPCCCTRGVASADATCNSLADKASKRRSTTSAVGQFNGADAQTAEIAELQAVSK